MTEPTNYDWTLLRAIADRALARDAPLDELLAELRAAGASPIASIKLLHDSRGLSVGEAKLAVFTSPVWSDAKAAHDQLEADVEEALGPGVSRDIGQR
jgi:ribosomal protein L7/L12